MSLKRRKDLVVNSITIVDDEGNPRIGMYVMKKSGYAGISFYKGKGKKRYEALQIYVSEQHQGHVEIWHKGDKTALTLGAGDAGAGLSIFDLEGKHLKGFGALYDDLKLLNTKRKRRAKPAIQPRIRG